MTFEKFDKMLRILKSADHTLDFFTYGIKSSDYLVQWIRMLLREIEKYKQNGTYWILTNKKRMKLVKFILFFEAELKDWIKEG